MSPSRRGSPWDLLRQRSATLRRGVEDLAREAEQLAAGADPIRASDVLEDELRKWRETLEGVAGKLTASLDTVRGRREGEAETLDRRIIQELTARGHQVHGDGAVFIVDGIAHVEVGVQRRQVKVNSASVSDLAPAVVAEAVDREVRRLREQLTAPAEMLDQLLLAYERELRLSGQAEGRQVPVTSLLLHVAVLRQRPAFVQNPTASNYREYSREQFRADLHGLLASGGLAIRGKRLRHASGADTSGAIFMLVPALGRPAYVGRMWFEPEQAEGLA